MLGIFLMRWTVVECIEKFTSLARQTFRPWRKSASPFARLQELAFSYLRDWQYSSFAIEQAFRSAFGTEINMFNPISEDTKEAVTTIAAKQPQSCVFTNYNGGIRFSETGYNLIRASAAADDVSISNAAACTSAAPWYFKAVALKNIGTFQDGGLHHNNPLSLALWEVKHLWPQCAVPDLALSIGTGVNESVFSIGPQSPVRKRSIFRIFESFMESMDGEKSWKDQPPYRRRVTFTLQALDNAIGITLRAITSEPTTISGLPKPARDLITAQRLHCAVPEKRLPNLPFKRKFEHASQSSVQPRQ